MKKTTVIIMGALLVFSAASLCYGSEAGDSPSLGIGLSPESYSVPTAEGNSTQDEKKKDAKKKKSSSRRLKQISGRITAIDRAEKSITVGGLTIITDERTLAGLKEGDNVRVDYYSKGVHRAIIVSREFK